MLRGEDGKFVYNRIKHGKEKSWCAVDLDRFIVHLFLPEARVYYDLETLWLCGAEFDENLVMFKREREQLERRLEVAPESPNESTNYISK